MTAPLRFDLWMEQALYGPAGFYRSGRGAGRHGGDFLTSPEVGPLFGVVVSRWLDATWSELGRPDPFVVAEGGAGRGALERSVRHAAPACAAVLEWLPVELSALPAAETVADLPARVDVVVANELLDNLPFRIVEWDGEDWLEVHVDARNEAVALPRMEPVSRCMDGLGSMVGDRLPVLDRARAWVELARGRGSRTLIFDYGVPTTVELLGRRWLRTYRDHEVGTDPFDAPGERDITADVAFDQLPEPAALSRQADWLRRWGIDELVDEGRVVWRERAHIGDLDALRARSRVREAEALVEASGLGSFLVAEWEGTADP